MCVFLMSLLRNGRVGVEGERVWREGGRKKRGKCNGDVTWSIRFSGRIKETVPVKLLNRY